MDDLEIFEKQLLQADQAQEKEANHKLMLDRLLRYCDNLKIERQMFKRRMTQSQFLKEMRDILLLPFPRFLILANEMDILNEETRSCFKIEKNIE